MQNEKKKYWLNFFNLYLLHEEIFQEFHFYVHIIGFCLEFLINHQLSLIFPLLQSFGRKIEKFKFSKHKNIPQFFEKFSSNNWKHFLIRFVIASTTVDWTRNNLSFILRNVPNVYWFLNCSDFILIPLEREAKNEFIRGVTNMDISHAFETLLIKNVFKIPSRLFLQLSQSLSPLLSLFLTAVSISFIYVYDFSK